MISICWFTRIKGRILPRVRFSAHGIRVCLKCKSGLLLKSLKSFRESPQPQNSLCGPRRQPCFLLHTPHPHHWSWSFSELWACVIDLFRFSRRFLRFIAWRGGLRTNDCYQQEHDGASMALFQLHLWRSANWRERLHFSTSGSFGATLMFLKNSHVLKALRERERVLLTGFPRPLSERETVAGHIAWLVVASICWVFGDMPGILACVTTPLILAGRRTQGQGC